MTTTQKSIAQALDSASHRAEVIDREGATGRQCWFLAKLILDDGGDEGDVGCEIINSQAVLTKRAASHWIDRYIKGE